ncbi:hypothetical protein [Pseudomonas viridiflava]|uniref:hypothetical protein n=1 Tax=Pseudomonas viridiflava TaxID=33069 RepID=UPI002EC7B26B|nr:hypothetical protein [Pseudomonas viridiflava]
MSQNLSKAQKYTLVTLSSISLVLAGVWLALELVCNGNIPFNMEPLVVTCASAIPILTLWWPFNPKYRSKRKSGRVTVQLHIRKTAEIGEGDYLFCPNFSTNSPTSVHLQTRFHPSLTGSAIAGDANHFTDVKDASSYQLSPEDSSPNIDDVFILKNRFNNYALLRILSIDPPASNVRGTDVIIEYIINPEGGLNFS